MEDGRQHIAPHGHKADEKPHPLPCRQGHGKPKAFGAIGGQGRNENQKEHCGQILEQQDAQGRLPMALLQLPRHRQFPGHKRRGGQSEAAANHDGQAQAELRVVERARKQAGGEHHLRGAQAEDGPPHRQHAG